MPSPSPSLIFLSTPLVPLFRPAPVRLRDLLTEPGAVSAPRPKGRNGEASRRPYTDATVARVRRLIEETALNYDDIAAKTGVGRASISRWTRDHGWQRHPFAPRATDTIPRVRAGQKLKLRLLAERLHKLAERYVRELEEAPAVDVDRLMQALNMLKMARLEAMGRRRRRKWESETLTGAQWEARDVAVRRALTEMRRGGVDLDRVPPDALDLVTHAHAPPEDDHPALRLRGVEEAMTDLERMHPPNLDTANIEAISIKLGKLHAALAAGLSRKMLTSMERIHSRT